MDYDYLLQDAFNASEMSYCPYSKYKAGAAVLAGDGLVYTGAQVENVSFGLSMCAERVAVFTALSSGADELIAIAVYHSGRDMPYPCGACLQVLAEFNHNMSIIVSNGEKTEQYQLGELLGKSFIITENTRGEI